MKTIDIPIVLVQLGSPSRYLKANLKYLGETFPYEKKVMITDLKNYQWIEDYGFRVVHVDELAIFWPNNFEISDRRKYFRDNFWFSTKARLILLSHFMLQTSTPRLLHFENDVWVNPRFPFEYFDSLDAPLAYPRVDDFRGIASVLYVNGAEGINILEYACNKWSNMTDMEILGKLMDENERVLMLDSYDRRANESGHWVFDAAKMGMYLFGADPRNSWGLIRRFKRSPMGALEYGDEIRLEKDILSVGKEKSRKEIANLHVHSKNRKVFSVHWKKSIRLQLEKEKKGYSREFKLASFLFKLNEFSVFAIRKVFDWRISYWH